MPAKTEPNSGLQWGWTLGEDGWNVGMDQNLLSLGRYNYHLAVLDRNVTDPSTLTPADGDTYLVATGAIGAWAGWDDRIAVWDNTGGSWVSAVPNLGWRCVVEDEDAFLTYSTVGWIRLDALGDDLLLVRRIEDLPDPTGDEVILPSKTIVLASDINLGSDAVRLSTGTLLRGFGGQMITSSNASGVVRATNIGTPLVMRELLITATAGPALDLQGAITQQLNLFFMGFFGASVGTVTGFDVQAYKDCFIDAADGLVLDGTTNKIFLSQCPFYGITAGNAAVTLAATFNAKRVDAVSNFFKADPASIGLRALAGYNVDYGRVTGSMNEGLTQLLDGISYSDDNWWLTQNDGILNSRVAAQTTLDAETTVVITTQNTYEHINGTFSSAPLSQRMTIDGNNDLVLSANSNPVLATFSASITLDPANNVRVGLRAKKNGVEVVGSQTYIEQGSGTANQARPAYVVALVELEAGDAIGLEIANLTDATDLVVESCNFSIVSS